MTDEISRRRLLRYGLGGAVAVVAAGVAGVELVSHRVVPGISILDDLDGACSVAQPAETFGRPGPTYTGTFYSHARNKTVGYTLAYPPGHDKGSELPLLVYFHAYGTNHRAPYGGHRLAQALAIRGKDGPMLPMAMVSADGGDGYWHRLPGDDPMAMVVDELLPMCSRLGLGQPAHGVASTGISMGGYGSILMAELHPELVRAVAAIGPAIWTSWPQAHNANPTAYSSAANFNSYDAVRLAPVLRHTPVRVASGIDDPFHPGVVALAERLPRSAVVDISHGCHTGPFFGAQVLPSLEFISAHLSPKSAV